MENFKTCLSAIETWVALNQQAYLRNNNSSFVNKNLSYLKYNYDHYVNDKYHEIKIQIYVKKNYNYEILYSGKLFDLSIIYGNLLILPWSEEIPMHLKPLTLYIYVRNDQSSIDEFKDSIDRASKEEEDENILYRLFTRKRKK